MNKRPWKEQWEIVEELTPGQQAHTFRVKRLGDQQGGGNFVLKVLKDQKSRERRGRMRRETVSLQTLDHPGVCKFVESNADRFQEDVGLYLVTEFVPGPDLRRVVKGGAVSLERAGQIILKILETLIYCHGVSVIHRDIKPEHVILRDGQDDRPVLLDFGLSFNEEDIPPGYGTVEGQVLGNRFLNLPELTSPGARRNEVSDVTQCVGLFYFLLTGADPLNLAGPNGRMPHHRPEVQSELGKVDEEKRRHLNDIFGTGFAPPVDERWPSAKRLAAEIQDLLAGGKIATQANWHDEIAALTSRWVGGPQLRRMKRIDDLARITQETLQKKIEDLRTKAADFLRIGFDGGRIDKEKGLVFCWKLTCRQEHTDRTTVMILRGVVDQGDYVIEGQQGDVSKEAARFGLFEPRQKDKIEAALNSYIIGALDSAFSE